MTSATLRDSQHHHHQDVPRGALIAIAVMVGLTLLMVALARLTGIGAPATDLGAIVSERHLRFADQPDGGIAVYDADSNQMLERIAPGTNGFLRGTLRGLGRERKREGIGREVRFSLVGTQSGHLLLVDPATQRRVDLGSFGPTNAAVFMRLLSGAAPIANERSPS